MYFDFDDYHPDISPVGQAISWREGVLLSIIAHLVFVILLLVVPKWFPFLTQSRPVPVPVQQRPDNTQFVFVQPRVERPAARAPERAVPSDLNRVAATPEKAPKPANPLPFSRGNSPERVEEPPKQVARGQGPQPDPAAGAPADNPPDSKIPRFVVLAAVAVARGFAERRSTVDRPPPADRSAMRCAISQRYTQNQTFDNPGGSGGQFGPEIQFDTKGVEFGPWIRRFIAQVKRNWLIPYAAMSMKGHVVMQFNVHKDGSITDLNVAGPSGVDAFNNAAFGALVLVESDPAAAAGIPVGQGLLHRHVLLQRNPAAVTRTQQLGLVILLIAFIVYVLVRVSMKPLGARGARSDRDREERARRSRSPRVIGGEIINCDSTAVYRGFDIGTDKIAPDERRGIPHHLIDIVDPTEEYTAAQYARDAAERIRDIQSRGRLPILVGGTGFYFRALTRGLFPGPGATRC